jgi:Flp pilus assembly protein TadG
VSTPDNGDEEGFTVVTAMWIMAVTMVLVFGFADLLIHRYAQAVIRQATDEGARAWAVNGGSAADCQAAASDVLSDLLSGSLSDGIEISCAETADTVVVTASATLAGLPPMPDAQFTTSSVVTKEPEDGLEIP